MVKKLSAGLLVFRRRASGVEVLLVHPGGPFWAKKNEGAWSIPKGEFEESEAPLDAARREFREETGFAVDGPFIELTPVRQPGGKLVRAWAVEADFDASAIRSETFTMEWPPRSGRTQAFPEVDRADWFGWSQALAMILKGQRPIVEQLRAKLAQA